MFAVGVGNYNLDELKVVASDPICSHVLTLTSFDHIQSILTEIQKSACEGESERKEKKKTTTATTTTTKTLILEALQILFFLVII